MARNEFDAMVAHTFHVKQMNALVEMKDRTISNPDLSATFKSTVVHQIDQSLDAIMQADALLMRGGGSAVRIGGVNLEFGSEDS